MGFPSKEVYVVVITGAAGQIGYSLAPLVAHGNIFGPKQKIELRLFDIPQAEKGLEGVAMELTDCAFPLLNKLVTTTDPAQAFKECDLVIMCGAFPRKAGMERADLLKKNASIFAEQGKFVAEHANAHCHVLIVGNPANTNALIFAHGAKSKIDPKNVAALTRLDHNRCLAQCAAKLHVPVASVKNVVIWGNHSGTQVPDTHNAIANDKHVRDIAKDDSLHSAEFMKSIQQRGAEVIKIRGASSALSAANAIVDHCHNWFCGTEPGVHVSMAVQSDNNPYGVPEGLYYSFPVTCKNGEWSIVPNLCITEQVKEMMGKTAAELMDERKEVGEFMA